MRKMLVLIGLVLLLGACSKEAGVATTSAKEDTKQAEDVKEKDNELIVEVDGKEYLLEKPLKADVALLVGAQVDKKGNIRYRKATRNFNPIMATAAELVIVEADEVVEVGQIDPDDIMTPGIFVDYIVGGKK